MKATERGARITGAALWLGLAATAVAGACANGGESDAAAGSAASTAGEQPTTEASEPMEGQGLEQPGGPIDLELASRGEQLFTRKGCVACHKIGEGRLVGPDLMGVTERRTAGWIVAMITAPDSMLRSDPTAKDLYAEYFTPMSDQKVQPEEARALYEYLRARTEGAMQSSSAAASEESLTLAGAPPHHGAGMGRRARHGSFGPPSGRGAWARRGAVAGPEPEPASAPGPRHRRHHRMSS